MFSDGSSGLVNPFVVQKVLTANKIIETSASKNNEQKKWMSTSALDLNTRVANDIQAG